MIAAIDIGSNSVRLMLYRGAAVTPKEISTTALAEGLAATGMLNSAAMERTLAAVNAFVSKARAEGAEPYIFATEAVRAAKNGAEFADMVRRRTGISVDVISGDEEAALGLMGALTGDEEIIAVDIGGASAEIVRGDRREIRYRRSLPLGAVRLTEAVGPRREDIEAFAAEAVARYGDAGSAPVVGIGGTATSLAAMALGQRTYDPFAVHGTVLTKETLASLIDAIFSSKDRTRDFPILSPRRASVIGHGAVLLKAILDHLKADSLTVSERDNLEGYVMSKRPIGQ